MADRKDYYKLWVYLSTGEPYCYKITRSSWETTRKVLTGCMEKPRGTGRYFLAMDSENPKVILGGIQSKHIIGFLAIPDIKSPLERIADATSTQMTEGESWKQDEPPSDV